MCLPNLLKRCLDLSNSVTLQVLNFLQRRSDDAEGLWVNSCGGQQLIDLSILRFQALLNRLMLLLENQVSQASLLMYLIDYLMELLLQILLLPLQVLELLQADLILPFNILRDILVVGDAFLGLSQG